MKGVTPGAQLAVANVLETRRVLAALRPDEIGALDPALGEWAGRPLGREALATAVLPTLGSVFMCLMNIEPAGLIAITRLNIGARIHLLAVVPDMRRRGLSRSMLLLAVDHAATNNLDWLWMEVPSDNDTAMKTALACGFKRYLPQFLRRSVISQLTFGPGLVHIEPAQHKVISRWLVDEAEIGDAWAGELIREEVSSLLIPETGAVFECMLVDRTIGLAHIAPRRDGESVLLTLWMERDTWGTPLELQALKALLNHLGAQSVGVDVHFGSSDHMRLAYAALRPHGFKPALKPRVLMLRHL